MRNETTFFTLVNSYHFIPFYVLQMLCDLSLCLLQPINDCAIDFVCSIEKTFMLNTTYSGMYVMQGQLDEGNWSFVSYKWRTTYFSITTLFSCTRQTQASSPTRWFFVCPIQQQQAHLWCVIYKLMWVTLKKKTFYTSKKENFYDLSYIHITMYYKPFIKRLYLTKIGSHTHPHIYKTCHIFLRLLLMMPSYLWSFFTSDWITHCF